MYIINSLISIILPSSLTIIFLSKMDGYRKELKYEYFLLSILLITLFNYGVTYFIFNHTEIAFTFLYSIKYILLSIVMTVPAAYVINILDSYVSLKVERNNKENDKKKEIK